VLGWGQAGLLSRLGTPVGLGKEELGEGAPALHWGAPAKGRSWGWTSSSEAVPVPRSWGVTVAEIRGDRKGWQSGRAGGKRIKQQLAGSARGGLAQPNTDLLPPAPDLQGWGRAAGGASSGILPSAHHHHPRFASRGSCSPAAAPPHVPAPGRDDSLPYSAAALAPGW